jgi:hypothetical protein
MRLLIAAIRAELERDGFSSMGVSDEQLAFAVFEPLRRAEERRLEALARVGDAADRAELAMRRFAEAFEAY